MTNDPKDLIWRYTNIFSLLHLIETKLFYLNQIGEMEDFSEGQLKGIYFVGKTVPAGKNKKSTKQLNNQIKTEIANGLKTANNTYISCWTNESHECNSHWKIFTSPSDGLVIKSSINCVLSSLKPSDVFVAKIKYLPNGVRRVVNPLNIKEIITTKLKYYYTENEVRFYLFPSEGNLNNHQNHIYLTCDPEILIEELRFSPFMEGWKIKLLTELLIKLAPYLKTKIKTSEIIIKNQNYATK